jgi:hypothetical protein
MEFFKIIIPQRPEFKNSDISQYVQGSYMGSVGQSMGTNITSDKTPCL